MIKGYLNYMINSATVGSKSVKSSKVEQTIASKTTFILSWERLLERLINQSLPSIIKIIK